MKQLKKFALIIVSAFVLPAMAWADGYHVDGRVIVTDTYLSGSMSVRYNTTVGGDPYLYANGFANSSISFVGRDDTGNYFSCSVPTTSVVYKDALDIRNGMTDGKYIYVTKDASGTECTNVYMLSASYWLE